MLILPLMKVDECCSHALLQGTFQALDEQNKGLMSVQLCFNFNRIHESVGKALKTADQNRVTADSHALSSSFRPGFNIRQYGMIRGAKIPRGC